MSVPTWRRDLSKAEYIYSIFQLNKTIASIVTKKPAKYKANYGDHLVKEGLEALKLSQIANKIYVNDKTSYELRRSTLLQLQGVIDNISTSAYLFLELVRNNDSVSFEKIWDEENKIGDACYSINKLVNGILRSDRERYKKKYK